MAEDSTLLEHETALASERKDRAEAILGLPELIAGVPVEPLTPLRLEWLRAVGNPFVCGGEEIPEAIVQFLWHISSVFKCPASAEERQAFAKPLMTMDARDLTEGIEAYLDRAFLDAPGDIKGPSFYAPTIGLYAALKESYPGSEWTLETVKVTPYRVLSQLIKCADKARGCSVINRRSYAVQAKWISELETLTADTEESVIELMNSKRQEGYRQVSLAQRSADGTWSLAARKEATPRA